jgi:phage gpG-like protein
MVTLSFGATGQAGIMMMPSASWLQGALNRFAGDLRSTRKPIERAVDEVIRPRIRANFGDESEAGVGWPPLHPNTRLMGYRAMYGAHDNPILDVTGKLKYEAQTKKIWKFQGQQSTAVASASAFTRAPYGPLHQSGTQHMPPRPFLAITEDDMNEIEDIFTQYIAERSNYRLAGGIMLGEAMNAAF